MRKIGYAVVSLGLLALMYFGTRGILEGHVVRSAVTELFNSEFNSENLLLPESVFISRPMTCEPQRNEIFSDEDLMKYIQANRASSRPLYLSTLEGVVPIMSREDTMKLFTAGYQWQAIERQTIWISRVGFSRYFSNATVCLRASDSAHGWGLILKLERDGTSWSITQDDGRANW